MNEYDDIIKQDATQDLQSSLYAAGNSKPDDEAALQRLSARTGVPLEAVRLKRPEVELADKMASFDYDKVIKESPKLSAWLADPKNAALAHDDVSNLSGVENLLRTGMDYAGAMGDSVVGGFLGNAMVGLGETYAGIARAPEPFLRSVLPTKAMDALTAPVVPWWLVPSEIIGRPGKSLKAAGDWMRPPAERQTLGTDVAAGVTQLGAQIGMALLTGGASTSVMLYGQGAGIMAEKTAKDNGTGFLTENIGMSAQTARDTAIIAGGAITMLTEKYGLGKLLNRVPPEVKNRTLRFIADKVTAGGIEAGQEFAEALLHDIARRTLTNKDGEMLAGVTREMSAAALSAAIVRTALGVKGHQRASQQEDFVRALTDQAASSKLRERMPEAFKKYLDQVTAGGPVENVFIPADRFNEFYQSQGLDPAVEASKLGVQNFAEASLAGGDVVISTSEFVTQLAGSDALQGLWSDLRFNQGDMTPREAKEFEDNRGDEAIDEETLARMTGAAPQASGFEQVREQIMGELVGRFDQSTANDYATQYATVLSTLAERAGVDPLALADTYKLDLSMPIPDALRAALDRVDIDLDPIIERLRAGDVPKADAAYGDSLAEFVRKNGLRMVGELRSLDETVGRKPGKKNIVRDGGLSLDDALQNAVEAGYFPGREADELTESDLIDALFEDAGGNKQYSSHNMNDRSVDELRMIEGLAEYLSSIGADVNTMSNAEIKAKMRADAAQDVAEVYNQGEDVRPRLDPTALQGRWQRDTTQRWDLPLQKLKRLNAEGRVTQADADAFKAIANGDEAKAVPALEKLLGEVKSRKVLFQSATETEAFKTWFGDSKVVDAEGKPLVVYHGTASDIAEFDSRSVYEGGIYFAQNPRLASGRARIAQGMGNGDAQNMIPAYVRIVNPAPPSMSVAQAKDEGYDGIIREGEIVAFEPTQIKSATGNNGNFDANNPSILFQSDQRDLIVTHNLTAANLLHAKKMGGIAVPSLAITKSDTPLTGFGEITLIGAKELADPKGYAGTKVFGADIYSPRYPQIAVSMNAGALKKLNASLAEALKAVGKSSIYGDEIRTARDLSDNPAVRWLALKDLGVDVAPVMRDNGTIDDWATDNAIRRALGDANAYGAAETKAREMLEQAGADEKIFQGYTASGNRKYVDHNIENVVKILKKELRGGEGYNYGAGSVRAKFTPQFKSIAQIKKEKGRLVSGQEFDAVKEEVNRELEAITVALAEFHPASKSFGFSDTVTSTMSDAATMGLPRALKENGFEDVPADAMKNVGEFMTRLRDLPTAYFEAKVMREVDVSEFAGAAVPDDASPAVLKALADSGVEVKLYKAGDETARAATIQQFDRLFFQNNGDKRGSIKIGANRKMTISLFEKADLSTFLHETGHFYLEVMGDLASRPDAAPGIVDDFQKILDWMGVAGRDQIEVKHHEMFARANEAYLMEGKAPSVELQPAFQRFKAWLNLIYKTVAALDITLSAELRGVFDRMYATDQQIEQAQGEVDYTAMFATAAEAGMSEAEFQAYTNSVGQTIEQGKERLQARLMSQYQRERTKRWKQEREKVAVEVSAEVDAEPVYLAFRALTTGLTDDGLEVKLSRADLVREFGEPFVVKLPRSTQRIYAADGGVDLDTAAEMFGFDSGRTLIEALANMQPRKALIEKLTGDRMVERFGDIRFDGTIAEEAINALHNDKREDVLKIELRAIRKKAREVAPIIRARDQAATAERQAGEQFVEDALPQRDLQGRTRAGVNYSYRAFDPEPMKRAAAGMIGQKQIKDLRPHGYLLAEKNAAKLGAAAMQKKDYMTAAEQKQRELLNHYLYKEALRVQDEVASKSNWLAEQGGKKRREALGKAGADYLEQVDEILERYEFKARPLRQLARRLSLSAWVDQQEALGNAVSVPEDVLNDARLVNWKEIPVDELRAVYDAVKNITHLASLKNKLIIKGEQRDFAEVRAELLAAIYAAPLTSTGELSLPNMSGATIGQKGAKLWRGFDAAHMKIEQLVAWLDNGDINGAWARNFFDLADGAQTAEYDLHRLVTMAIDNLRKEMPSSWRSGLDQKMGFDLPLVTGGDTAVMAKPTRYTLLSIAMNMGNEQNLQRLRDGNKFTDAQLQRVRDALTDDDLKFVQGVWDAVELLWPQMAALEKRASGLAPEKVEPASFEVRGQTYRGGYFPLVYDARISTVGERQVEGDMSVEAFVANGFGRPSTNKGATQKRQAVVNQPLKLDLNEVVGGHIAKVVKDISHREAVMGLYSILSDGQIKAALIDRMGEAYYREMRDWTKVLVNDRTDTMNAAKGWAKGLMVTRTNLAIMVMGWKISTAFSQFAGFGPAADLVGPVYLSRALLQSMGDLTGTWKMVSEKSGEMRNRVATIDRDVRDAMRRIADKRSIVADIQRSAFFLTAYADRIVSVPTWLAGYNKAIAEGQSEETAIRAGDRAVRLSQGAGGAKDLAAVQRNNELMRLMTMFYTPFSALYARLRDVGHQQAVQGIGYLPMSVARLLALVAIPAVLGEILAGRGPDDDEDKVWWAVRRVMLYPLATIPFIRDTTGLMEKKIIQLTGEGQMKFQPSYRLSPVEGAISKVFDAGGDWFDVTTGDKEIDADLLGDTFESSGLVLGLPTAQVRITGSYLFDLMNGDAQPENAPDVMKGVLFRRKKEK